MLKYMPLPIVAWLLYNTQWTYELLYILIIGIIIGVWGAMIWTKKENKN